MNQAFRLNFFEKPIRQLHESNRKPEIKESFAIPSNSRDGLAHVLRKVECLTVPFEQADVVEDSVTVWICSCEDFEYNRWPSDGSIPDLETLSQCRHCNLKKSEKAQSDENQTELQFAEQ